jgi:1-deoxy-D-xylulose-5-phosphate reductoisomerase
LFDIKELTFEKPNTDKFPCLRLCLEAAEIGGTMPAVLNAANETAVAKFLSGEISFTKISEIIESVMLAYNVKYGINISDVLEADRWAREAVQKINY